jgi:hypothetical protein
MRRTGFPGRPEVLCQAELNQRVKHSFEITIRWFLTAVRRPKYSCRTEQSHQREVLLAKLEEVQRLLVRRFWNLTKRSCDILPSNHQTTCR